jgi:hypothetical protein
MKYVVAQMELVQGGGGYHTIGIQEQLGLKLEAAKSTS